jgi:hypothetical protein
MLRTHIIINQGCLCCKDHPKINSHQAKIQAKSKHSPIAAHERNQDTRKSQSSQCCQISTQLLGQPKRLYCTIALYK